MSLDQFLRASRLGVMLRVVKSVAQPNLWQLSEAATYWTPVVSVDLQGLRNLIKVSEQEVSKAPFTRRGRDAVNLTF